MKQRVAVALATVWLASIVGASVPSGETTTISTPHSPGPSPDQYTPLLRSPRHNPQDDYGQDWMNDEPSRIKVENRDEKFGQKQRAITDLNKTPLHEFARNESARRIAGIDEDPDTPYHFESNDMQKQSELDREAMRMSSMKVAFDGPIDSESYDRGREDGWISHDVEEEGAMQQDGQFVADDIFEDQGPGSVEVYKLDLYNDRSILSPMPSRKDYLRNKSKIPKKVLPVDQLAWKAKDPEVWKHVPKIVSKFDRHTFPVSSRSFKERIFGIGGVPELQVGCEGVEGSQRQKRSEPGKPDGKILGTEPSPSARDTQVNIEPDYESEEDLEEVAGEDELINILRQATSTTESSSNKNRGDMDPRAEPKWPRKKDKLPTRGDLGPSGDPDSSYNDQVLSKISIENQTQLTSGRKLLSVDDEMVENDRNKRSADQGYGENDSVMNERNKSGHRGAQGHRGEDRRRRRGKKRERKRQGNRVGGRRNAVDKTGSDYRTEKKNDIRRNRLVSVTRNQRSNSLHQPSARQSGRNEDYGRQHDRKKEGKMRSIKEARNGDDIDRKLQAYISKITPIPREKSINNQIRRQEDNEWRGHDLKNDAPQNLQLPLPVDPSDRGDGGYERPQNPKYAEGGYQRQSQQEIDRLNALPVSAQIIISRERPGIPSIGNRFGKPDITFPGLSPGNEGRQVPNFPSPPTSKPPVKGPSPCVWAVINCCSNKSRLATCFEANGCHGGHWDDPCSKKKQAAALLMVQQQFRG